MIFMVMDADIWTNAQAMAPPLAGASVDRGVDVEVR
jgi:hypothetical protein